MTNTDVSCWIDSMTNFIQRYQQLGLQKFQRQRVLRFYVQQALFEVQVKLTDWLIVILKRM